MKLVDKIISAPWIIPVIPKNKVLTDYCIAVKNDMICDLLPIATANKKYSASETISYRDKVLMPGFINTHAHTPMVLLRGIGDSLPLQNWLNDCIWPAEKKLMSKKFIADGTKLGIAEMLLNGITCFSEHYFMPEVTANICQEIGIRALVGIGMHDNLMSNDLAKDLIPNSNDLVSFAYAPHSPYLLNDTNFKRLLKTCEQYPAPIHIHLHETNKEITDSIKKYNVRPITRLKNLGLLEQHLIAVHMVHCDDTDLELLSNKKCDIVNCPDSNLKLGSGICNIQKFADIGLNIAIGTDGAASNNDLNLLAEARTAGLLNKAVNTNASLSPAADILHMLTINGAQALGLAQKTGSIEIGKQADLIAWDLDNINSYPRHNLISQIIFAGNTKQIQDVWVAGSRLVKAGKLTKLTGLTELAQYWEQKTLEFNI